MVNRSSVNARFCTTGVEDPGDGPGDGPDDGGGEDGGEDVGELLPHPINNVENKTSKRIITMAFLCQRHENRFPAVHLNPGYCVRQTDMQV